MKAQSTILNTVMAAQLKQCRQDAKLTMRQLAEKLPTPHSFIGKIEQQARRLDVGEFICYCIAMKQNPVEVLQRIVDTHQQQ